MIRGEDGKPRMYPLPHMPGGDDGYEVWLDAHVPKEHHWLGMLLLELVNRSGRLSARDIYRAVHHPNDFGR